MVDAEEFREEIEVNEFFREPISEGDGVVIGETNDKDPLESN